MEYLPGLTGYFRSVTESIVNAKIASTVFLVLSWVLCVRRSPLLLYSIAATTDEFGDFTRTESSPIRSRPPKKTPPKTILEKEEEEEKKSAVSFKAQKGRRKGWMLLAGAPRNLHG